MVLKTKIIENVIYFENNGKNCSAKFHRTVRLPMDGKIYPCTFFLRKFLNLNLIYFN
jgi:hypothetical protein